MSKILTITDDTQTEPGGFFLWDDDVAIPFTRADGRILVKGEALVRMIGSAIWAYEHRDIRDTDISDSPLTTLSIAHDLSEAYTIGGTDVTAWAKDLPPCDEDANEIFGGDDAQD